MHVQRHTGVIIRSVAKNGADGTCSCMLERCPSGLHRERVVIARVLGLQHRHVRLSSCDVTADCACQG